MASVFTEIIRGEEPAWFVWRDDRCVAFLAATPVRPGHLLVVPIAEVDDWLHLEDDDAAHLLAVARTLGRAVKSAFAPRRVGLMIAGFDVAHVHLHVVPLEDPHDLDYDNQRPDVDDTELDAVRSRILDALEP